MCGGGGGGVVEKSSPEFDEIDTLYSHIGGPFQGPQFSTWIDVL